MDLRSGGTNTERADVREVGDAYWATGDQFVSEDWS